MEWDPKTCSPVISITDGGEKATRFEGGRVKDARVFGVSSCERFSVRISFIGVAWTLNFQVSFVHYSPNKKATYYNVDIRDGRILIGNKEHGNVSLDTDIGLIYDKKAHEIRLKVDGKECGVVASNVTGDLRPALNLQTTFITAELS
jgi:hypothetical protein